MEFQITYNDTSEKIKLNFLDAIIYNRWSHMGDMIH